MATYFMNTMNSFDVALSSEEQCQTCRHCIQKGRVRFSEIYWSNSSDGINRRFYHDSCALATKVTFQNMPLVQRINLEKHRTKLIRSYSEGRVLLAERRDLCEKLQQLNLPLSKSPVTTSDILEDIAIKLPLSNGELVNCHCMTPSLVQLYGAQIVQAVLCYKNEQQCVSSVPHKCQKRQMLFDVPVSSSSPVTTTKATMSMMVDGESCVNEFNSFQMPPPPPPLTNFGHGHHQLNVPTLLSRMNAGVPACSAFQNTTNKRMKHSTTNLGTAHEQRYYNTSAIHMMTD